MKKIILSLFVLSLFTLAGCASAPVEEELSVEEEEVVEVEEAVVEEVAAPIMEEEAVIEKEESTKEAVEPVVEKEVVEKEVVAVEEVAEPNKVSFNLTGADFAFSQKVIKVKKGDVVTIVFKSNQGFHDWVVDKFSAATKQVKADEGSTQVTFTADKVGTFEYYCSVGAHRAAGMVGQLVVE